MAKKNLEELFTDELKDVYDAEKRVVRSLPKLIKGAQAPQLVKALEEHLGETRVHVERLEGIFNEMGKTPARKACKAMSGLLAEAEELLDVSGEPAISDAAIIAAGQKVEHYEIATYGTLREWALQLGLDDAASMLLATLDEETKADKRLGKIAHELKLVPGELVTSNMKH